MSDPFWGDQPNILWQSERWTELLPSQSMSRVEKINALTRLCIAIGLVGLLHFREPMWLYVPLAGLSLLWFVARHFPEPETFTDGTEGDGLMGGPNTRDDEGNLYREPTKDNPFMNVLLTDYVDQPQRPPAGDVEDPKVKTPMEQLYAKGLFTDVDDIWGRNNSQRQFYSNPSTTIPNDRDSFMKWCYNTPYVCKDGDQAACLRYEDVRGHGQIK